MKYRGYGYAKETVYLILDYYFNEFGGEVMFDEVMNETGIHVLTSYIFEKVSEMEARVFVKISEGPIRSNQEMSLLMTLFL